MEAGDKPRSLACLRPGGYNRAVPGVNSVVKAFDSSTVTKGHSGVGQGGNIRQGGVTALVLGWYMYGRAVAPCGGDAVGQHGTHDEYLPQRPQPDVYP